MGTAEPYEHIGYQRFIGLKSLAFTAPPPACPNPVPGTDDNIEGPYYRAGSPWRTDIADENELGRRLIIRGSVVDRCGKPIRGSILDIWQATKAGHYDNDGSQPAPGPSQFRLRGQLKTNQKGRYKFKTIWPGAYPIGNGIWRPSHIHVKIRSEGYRELTTQLYFKGDPYNDGDFGYKPSLELNPIEQDGFYVAQFKFVIFESC